MDRRRFLRLLGFAAAAAAVPTLPGLELDPEKGLWIPGAKTFFDLGAGSEIVPVDTEWVAIGGNTFLTVDFIAQEALRVLENSLKGLTHINRNYDDDCFALSYPKIGDTINVRKPPRFS